MSKAWVPIVVDAVVVGATKLCIGLVVLSSGFSAISDDDFSRVVIAQRWAASPVLDPSGTSWLPLPFWLNGLVMMIGDRSLATARGVALALGVLAAIGIYGAARLLCPHRRDAYLGALVAAVVPSAAVLGVATVPELPAAALAAVGVATVTSQSARHRLLGASALLLACLCRYEPWLVAAVFAVMTVWDGWRGRLVPELRSRQLSALAALLALAGPIFWVVHNGVAHGDPLHFLARVSNYQQALGPESSSTWSGAGAALLAYPLQLLRQEPELWLLAALLLGQRWVASRRAGRPVREALPAALRRVVVIAGVMVAGLGVAALRGGVPTHHIGRPLVLLWLLAAVFVGAEASRLIRESRRRDAALGLGLGVLLAAGSAVWVRPSVTSTEPFVDRSEQLAVGRVVADVVPAGSAVLLQVVDYGYFAVMAASGRPEAFVLDQSVDPRKEPERSSFTSRQSLQAKVAATGASYLAADRMVTPILLGPPLREVGRWGIWRLR